MAQRVAPHRRHGFGVIHPEYGIAPLTLAKIHRESEQHIEGDHKQQDHQSHAAEARPAAQKFSHGVAEVSERAPSPRRQTVGVRWADPHASVRIPHAGVEKDIERLQHDADPDIHQGEDEGEGYDHIFIGCSGQSVVVEPPHALPAKHRLHQNRS